MGTIPGSVWRRVVARLTAGWEHARVNDRPRSVWQGERVRLRAVRESDWETFNAWDQDDEMGRSGSWIAFPRSPEATRRWTAETATAEPKDDGYRWVIERLDETPVGTILTHTCDRRNGTFSYGVAIARDHWRQGYASEAIRLVLHYFFEELGYGKVTVNVYEFNGTSIKLHERLGFQREGRLRRMVFTRGRHHDVLVFGMTAEDLADPANAVRSWPR